MTTIDLYLSNAVVYNVQDRVAILIGEEFTILVNDYTNEQVFSNNDKVLDINQSNGEILFKSSWGGSSTVLFMAGDVIAKKLVIDVVDKVSMPATTLGITNDEPETK